MEVDPDFVELETYNLGNSLKKDKTINAKLYTEVSFHLEWEIKTNLKICCWQNKIAKFIKTAYFINLNHFCDSFLPSTLWSLPREKCPAEHNLPTDQNK